MTDTTLENIFSGRGEAAPSPEPEAVVETPVAEAPAPEQPEPSAEPETPSNGGEQAMVPVAALKEERAKAKRYTEAVASFEQKLAETNAQWQKRFDEMMARFQQPQAQPQQDQAPDFWESPEAAVQALVQQAIAPVVQQVTYATEQASQREAIRAHGEETVKAAFEALRSRAGDPVAAVEYQRIMQSGDPWGNLVQWYDKQPERLEARVRAQVLEEIKQQGHLPVPPQPAAAAPAVMPSDLADARSAASRSGPAYSGPPTLQDIFKR